MTSQNKIDAMYGGDETVIISNINASDDILVMNAIISGTQRKIKDSDFIAGVSNAKKTMLFC